MQSFLYNLPHSQAPMCYFWAMNMKFESFKYYLDKSKAALQATVGVFASLWKRQRFNPRILVLHVEGVRCIPGSRPWIVCVINMSHVAVNTFQYTHAVADKNTFSLLKIHSVFTDTLYHLEKACWISYAQDKSINITEILESCLTSCVSDTSEMLLVYLQHYNSLSLNTIPS